MNESFVWSAPAPLRATLLRVRLMQLSLIVNVPAGTRTTVLFGAEVIALLIEVPVTVPPKSVLQAEVTQLAHEPLGMSPTTPAVDQFAARLGAIIPDHCCACAEIGTIKTNINARKHRNRRADLIYTSVSARRI
ncbi:MAG: hypothetical protein DMG44_13450 [Acidobacteria bacterium]|nr:MAG: hypothetical protein DMG44_13450 [Acidobacteriota bacterium]